MEILWIEDKPKVDNQDNKLFYDTGLFESNTHKLHIPKTFDESILEIESAKQKYDLVVFDINLEEFPVDEKVEKLSSDFDLSKAEFLRESGFHLYQSLIRQGFTDQRIVFLTGHASIGYRISSHLKNLKEAKESGDIKRFIKIIEKINLLISEEDSNLLKEKINSFQDTRNFDAVENFLTGLIQNLKAKEKNKDLYDVFEERFRQALLPLAPSIHKSDVYSFHSWLKSNMTNKNPDFGHITLRRGVKKACEFLKNELKNKNNSQLNNYILFNKTADLELRREYIKDYLTKLENFFPLNPSENKEQLFYLFLKELSAEWEMSRGYLKEGDFNEKEWVDWTNKEKLEFNFKNTCQRQMKLLRNWTSHYQLTKDLNEKDVAFFFMLAMRAWFDLRVDIILDYEKILSEIFNADKKFVINEGIKHQLAKSYQSLRKELGEYNPLGNEFIDLIKTLVRKSDNMDYLKNLSKKLFYQNFWHGLFPASLNVARQREDKDSVVMFVNFEYKDIPENSFPYFLGRLIYSESFN
ncbi:MAG: hypothetical protein ACTSX0_06300 [Promethearchaeota archaeon]